MKTSKHEGQDFTIASIWNWEDTVIRILKAKVDFCEKKKNSLVITITYMTNFNVEYQEPIPVILSGNNCTMHGYYCCVINVVQGFS